MNRFAVTCLCFDSQICIDFCLFLENGLRKLHNFFTIARTNWDLVIYLTYMYLNLNWIVSQKLAYVSICFSIFAFFSKTAWRIFIIFFSFDRTNWDLFIYFGLTKFVLTVFEKIVNFEKIKAAKSLSNNSTNWSIRFS